MADSGSKPEEIFQAIDQRWGIEYPATNSAVLNGGIVATSVWFGEGDFSKTLQLAVHAADFADTDCNAANSESVVAAIGTKVLPPEQVSQLHDRMAKKCAVKRRWTSAGASPARELVRSTR